MAKEARTLYIFIDESGNFDFDPRGTKHFVLTAVSTFDPSLGREKFYSLKYDLLAQGLMSGEGDSFHATEDAQSIRDQVFTLAEQVGGFWVDAIVAEKRKANPSLYIRQEMKSGPGTSFKIKTIRTEEKFYHLISQTLLKYIFKRHQGEEVESIVVVLGALFNGNKRGYVLKSLKQYFKTSFNKPFRIYFHPSCSDINCQIADYCCWAIYVYFERNETRPIRAIKSRIKSVFSIFKRGTTYYY